MKHQHPADPNLFWCSKCQRYKKRDEFTKRGNVKHGVENSCRECRSQTRSPTLIKRCERCGIELVFNGDKMSYKGTRYCPICKILVKQYILRQTQIAHHDEYAKKCLERNNASVKELSDSYVKRILTIHKIIKTPETIELKRQTIIMHRTLNQFKKWREDYEKVQKVA